MKESVLKKLQDKSKLRKMKGWPPPIPPKGNPYSDAAIERRIYIGAKKVLDRLKSRSVSSMITEAWGVERKDKIIRYLTDQGLKCEVINFDKNIFTIKVNR